MAIRESLSCEIAKIQVETLRKFISRKFLSRKFLSRKFLSRKFLSRKFLSRKFLSRKFLSRKFLSRKFLSRKFLSRKFLSRKFLSRKFLRLKYNIVKHLKSCYSVNIRKKSVAQNKICDICGKEFAQKSNRDRHVTDFHSTNVAKFDIDESDIPEFEELPTMTATIFSHHEVINLSSEATQPATSSTSRLPSVTSSKQSRLESITNKLTNNIDYSLKFNQCVAEKLKKDLVNNKRKAVAYMRECFDSMLDDDDFLKWLGTAVGFKPYRLKRILSDKKFNRRNSQLPQSIYQDIYDFWLSKSITSNDSTNNIKRITKKDFLQQYKK